MSFVTAAMLYLSRNARQRANIKAVFPEPTGLDQIPSQHCEDRKIVSVQTHGHSPANANGEGSLFPVSSTEDGKLPSRVRACPAQNLLKTHETERSVHALDKLGEFYSSICVHGCARD